MKASRLNKEFFKNKRVFLTGHTGFKGTWLTLVLNEIGAISRGYALKPEKGCLFEKVCGENLIDHVEGDICDAKILKKALYDFQPEIVLHLAAVATVNEGFESPVKTYRTNALGTANLLEAVRECESVKSVLAVTSDKVYENKGDGAVYCEEDRLGGIDPYSVSKVSQELITLSHKQTYLKNIGVATGRASNVLAGGDHNAQRLIPSILSGFASNAPVELRNPFQMRPWQSVLDALNGYLTIARKCYEEPLVFSGAWNIGPTTDGIRPVADVVAIMQDFYESAQGYTHGCGIGVKESATLGLDITKSVNCLGWEPEQSLESMLEHVVLFFKLQQKNIPELEICQKQIKSFFMNSEE